MLKIAVIITVVLIFLVSPVLAADHLEFGRALEVDFYVRGEDYPGDGKYFAPNLLIAYLTGDSRTEFEKAEKEISMRCEKIQPERNIEYYKKEPWDYCGKYCDVTRECFTLCREAKSEATELLKQEYKKAAVLYQEYNEEILKQVLPLSKQKEALLELNQIFSNHAACIDTLPADAGSGLYCRIFGGPYGYSHWVVTEELRTLTGESDKCVNTLESLRNFEKKYLPFKIETGKTLSEWKEIILRKTGAGSQASKAVVSCENAISQQKLACAQYDGWMVDIAADISVFGSDERYEYQEIATQGGCAQGTSPRTTVDSSLFDSGSGDYQVICSVNCYSWECSADSEVDSASEVKPQGLSVQKADGTFKAEGELAQYNSGDVIKTGKGNSLIMALSEDSTVSLGPESTLEIDAFDFFNEEYSYILRDGRLSADIKSLLGSLTFKTPSATYAIAGTEFILEYDLELKKSTLHLYEGKVELTTLGGETKQVVAGESVVVDTLGTIETSPLSVSEDEWNSKLEKTLSNKSNFDLKANYVNILYGVAALIFIISIAFIIKRKTLS